MSAKIFIDGQFVCSPNHLLDKSLQTSIPIVGRETLDSLEVSLIVGTFNTETLLVGVFSKDFVPRNLVDSSS